MTRDEVFERVAAAIARVFNLNGSGSISRSTTSADVEGWDSLSHAMLIMEIEGEFGIDLPLDRAYQAADAGELADLVQERAT